MEDERLRVVVDTAELRRPHAGMARAITGLVNGLGGIADLEVIRAAGPDRVGSGLFFRPINVALHRWWYDFGMRRTAQRHGADVLLLPGSYSCSRGRIPQLVMLHDVNYLTQPGTYDPMFVRYAKWTVRRTIRNADGLMTVSAFSRDEICRHLGVDPARISVVHNGLDAVPEGSFPSPLDRPYALYVGATEKHKNVGLLVDAWEQLDSPLCLVIVGRPGRDHSLLADRAAKSRGRVLLIGSVDQSQLEAWYRHAAVFLFPSLTEGFGFPPLEAMQRGIPVIASRSGSLPEVLGNAAAYFDPYDSAELVARLQEILDDNRLRAQMIGMGREQAAKFTWAAAASSTVKLLEGLTHRG